MLHTVNKLQPSQAITQCLTWAADGDAVVLINDAVAAGLPGSAWSEEVEALARRCAVYVLVEDGAQQQPLPGVTVIDFSQFVALAAQHQHSQNWY